MYLISFGIKLRIKKVLDILFCQGVCPNGTYFMSIISDVGALHGWKDETAAVNCNISDIFNVPGPPGVSGWETSREVININNVI